MPRPGTPLVHPRLMETINADATPTVVTIQASTDVRAGTGEITKTWADVDDLVALAARKMPETAPAAPLQERRREADTVTVAIWRVWLPAAYPQITTAHRAVVDGQAFNIVTVGLDANATQTVLVVELVTR
jgi:head-tail adaptor